MTLPEVVSLGKLTVVPPFEIPGIGTAAAYASGDALGTKFELAGVPKSGRIIEARFHDLDNEGIDKELWVLDGNFTAQADNDAFALSDADNLQVIAVFVFSTWRPATNNQVGLTLNTPAAYFAPHGKLFCQIKTLGVDNIAAGSIPRLSLVIERHA